MSEKIYDAIIIGGGVVGAAVARSLSRYELSVCLLEKEEDVCSGTSKANSAIVHAGFDALPGTQKAKFNVKGNAMMDKLSEELSFEFKRNGSLVLCFSDEDMPSLGELYRRGIQNGRLHSGSGCKDIHHRRPCDRVRHHRQRDLRPFVLAVGIYGLKIGCAPCGTHPTYYSSSEDSFTSPSPMAW